MQEILFDHVFTVCKDNNLEQTLEKYQQVGMLVDTDITKHGYGNYSGFTLLTGTYLEFITFYDRSLWRADVDTKAMVDAHRPYGVALRCVSADRIYQALCHDYPESPKTYSAGRKDEADARPIWNFFTFPPGLLPGVHCFAVEYLRLATERSKLAPRKGENGAFFLSGYIFCSSDVATCESRCERWFETLSKITQVKKISSRQLQLAYQQLEWITPVEYAERFQTPWVPVDSIYSELAAIKLLSENLSLTKDFFQKLLPAPSITVKKEEFFISPHPNTGMAFHIERGDLENKFLSLKKSQIFSQI